MTDHTPPHVRVHPLALCESDTVGEHGFASAGSVIARDRAVFLDGNFRQTRT